jgi:hypothetical protein
MLPTKFRFIWPSFFGEDLKKSANQKQELPVAIFKNLLRNRLAKRTEIWYEASMEGPL